ncbi:MULTISPECIES: YcgL domain-containing protein [unclassified Luteimonas]|uniref:YcgL domain-containing protein n=1 Tax=unclassified Luteimonas TaxID=2629088 RepID=UPI00160325D0|nr:MULTISPECIES: YcgL domain-containing protein [unclassified Luteimonas]MBB1473447.1 YcgL domain-containing protein [Luteimonas sp. MC1782]MBB6600383.1 YcgL domain-containing protein [Luteimonas sp. MC1825]QOC88057.1 YcgL domain-containing protein [Luteimonas sp. MC1825]
MHAYVYKSLRKADTYVYLAEREEFERLPESLRAELGELQFVLEVALEPGRRLAIEDAAVVRGNLALRGFHLQMPPRAALDPMTEDWGTDA